MTKSQAGQLGGKKTAAKYGADYMRELAKRGAKAMHLKYKLKPLGMGDFAIVDRLTGIPLPKTLSGAALPTA